MFKSASKNSDFLKTKPINGFDQNNDLKRVKLKDATKHFTSVINAHGWPDRSFVLQVNKKNNFIKKYFDGISDKDFEKLKSFYVNVISCHGGYYDEETNIFDELQKKLTQCKREGPRCFICLLKGDYVAKRCCLYDPKKQKLVLKELPFSVKKDKPVIYEELYTNKDKYFDYYYVTKDAIYKVPHELVHNRVKLIDEGKFDKEFQKTQNIDINTDEKDVDKVITRKIDPKVEFKEFYDYRLKNLQDTAPITLKDYF